MVVLSSVNRSYGTLNNIDNTDPESIILSMWIFSNFVWGGGLLFLFFFFLSLSFLPFSLFSNLFCVYVLPALTHELDSQPHTFVRQRKN